MFREIIPEGTSRETGGLKPILDPSQSKGPRKKWKLALTENRAVEELMIVELLSGKGNGTTLRGYAHSELPGSSVETIWPHLVVHLVIIYRTFTEDNPQSPSIKIFAAKRSENVDKDPGMYTLMAIGGHCQQSEQDVLQNLKENLRREIREECNLTVTSGSKEPRFLGLLPHLSGHSQTEMAGVFTLDVTQDEEEKIKLTEEEAVSAEWIDIFDFLRGLLTFERDSRGELKPSMEASDYSYFESLEILFETAVNHDYPFIGSEYPIKYSPDQYVTELSSLIVLLRQNEDNFSGARNPELNKMIQCLEYQLNILIGECDKGVKLAGNRNWYRLAEDISGRQALVEYKAKLTNLRKQVLVISESLQAKVVLQHSLEPQKLFANIEYFAYLRERLLNSSHLILKNCYLDIDAYKRHSSLLRILASHREKDQTPTKQYSVISPGIIIFPEAISNYYDSKPLKTKDIIPSLAVDQIFRLEVEYIKRSLKILQENTDELQLQLIVKCAAGDNIRDVVLSDNDFIQNQHKAKQLFTNAKLLTSQIQSWVESIAKNLKHKEENSDSDVNLTITSQVLLQDVSGLIYSSEGIQELSCFYADPKFIRFKDESSVASFIQIKVSVLALQRYTAKKTRELQANILLIKNLETLDNPFKIEYLRNCKQFYIASSALLDRLKGNYSSLISDVHSRRNTASEVIAKFKGYLERIEELKKKGCGIAEYQESVIAECHDKIKLAENDLIELKVVDQYLVEEAEFRDIFATLREQIAKFNDLNWSLQVNRRGVSVLPFECLNVTQYPVIQTSDARLSASINNEIPDTETRVHMNLPWNQSGKPAILQTEGKGISVASTLGDQPIHLHTQTKEITVPLGGMNFNVITENGLVTHKLRPGQAVYFPPYLPHGLSVRNGKEATYPVLNFTAKLHDPCDERKLYDNILSNAAPGIINLTTNYTDPSKVDPGYIIQRLLASYRDVTKVSFEAGNDVQSNLDASKEQVLDLNEIQPGVFEREFIFKNILPHRITLYNLKTENPQEISAKGGFSFAFVCEGELQSVKRDKEEWREIIATNSLICIPEDSTIAVQPAKNSGHCWVYQVTFLNQ